MAFSNNNDDHDLDLFCLATRDGGVKWTIVQRMDGALFDVATVEGCSQPVAAWIVESMNELHRSEQRFLVRRALAEAFDKRDEQMRLQKSENRVRRAEHVIWCIYQIASEPQKAAEAQWQPVLNVLRAYFERFRGT